MIQVPTTRGNIPPPEKQYLVIVNVFERVADHADAHVDQVRGGHLKNLLWELLAVLVDLLLHEDEDFFYKAMIQFKVIYIYQWHHPHLHSQMGDDGSLVPLQRLQGDVSDLRLRLPHEHLAGCSQHLFILTLNLHL